MDYVLDATASVNPRTPANASLKGDELPFDRCKGMFETLIDGSFPPNPRLRYWPVNLSTHGW